MKEIPLTQGQVALVDDDDAEWLSKRKWQATYFPSVKGYYATCATRKNGKRTCYLMHRVIMNTPKHLECDHKFHNTLDNRRKHLQNVTHRENHENRRRTNPHGVGVQKKTDAKRKKPYFARLQVKGENVPLGSFATAEEARRARQEFLESGGGEN